MRAGIGFETPRDNCMDCGHTREEHDAEDFHCYGDGDYCDCTEFKDEERYEEYMREVAAQEEADKIDAAYEAHRDDL